MRTSLFTMILAVLAFSSVAAHAKDLRGSIEYKGYTRTFKVHLPKNHTDGNRYPLVIVLHGGGGKGRQMARFTRFSDLADRESFITVYPDGVGHQWNDGRSIEQSQAHREHVDDVGFLSGLIDYMVRQYGADARRVYCTGISNGALMSYRMACEKPDKITAIAAVAGNLPEHLAKKAPAGPVPVIIINGTEDPLIPWSGGPVKVPFMPGERGRVIGAMDTAAFWAKTNGCSGTSEDNLSIKDGGDGCRIIRHGYKSCAGGADVVLYEVAGGGHTWPGGPQYLPVRIVGRACKNIDATEIIWNFFKAHEKK